MSNNPGNGLGGLGQNPIYTPPAKPARWAMDMDVGESVLARDTRVQAKLTNGRMVFSFFKPRKTELISSVATGTGNNVSTAATLQRIGIYEVSQDRTTLTLVASTATDIASLWSVAFTKYTRSLQAPWLKKADQLYAWSPLCVGSTNTPNLVADTGLLGPMSFDWPPLYMTLDGQTDLPASTPMTSVQQQGDVFQMLMYP